MINSKYLSKQIKNAIPQVMTNNLLQNREIYRKPISSLQEGEVFGEVALYSKLKRTCSVKTTKTSIFQTLSRKDLKTIEQKFPSLHECFNKNMANYNDEDMLERKLFINNIPYLRSLDEKTI